MFLSLTTFDKTKHTTLTKYRYNGEILLKEEKFIVHYLT